MSTEDPMSTDLNGVDWVIIAAYFVVVIGIGVGSWFWTGRKGQGETSGVSESEEYFLAGRSAAFWAVGASLFASNIGSEHFIGLAGSGAKAGMSVSWGEWLSPWAILLLGWMLLPFYLSARIFTMPEFLERRYSWALRVYYAVLLLVLYVLTKISVALYAGAVILQETVGVDIWVGAGVLVVATGAYTLVGGMGAVIYTEVLQTVVLLVGGLVLLWKALAEVGGMERMFDIVPEENSHLFQPPNHEDFPWTGVLFGMPFTSIWYWCTDQNVVQRVLSAKNKGHGRAGTIMAAFLKILPPFMMVVPGIAARALFDKEMQEHSEGYNVAFPLLVMKLLPSPLLGLMVASMLAALMSSLASVFNSTSTIFTMDVWRRIRPSATDKELVSVGRVATLVTTVLGLLWVPLVRGLKAGLYVYTHKVMAYLSPPITVIFLGGVLWPRANTHGAASCLAVGLVVGLSRLFCEVGIPHTPDIDSSVLLYCHSNFLHFAIFFGWLSVFVLVAVSLMSPAPHRSKVEGLTWRWASRGGGIQLKPLTQTGSETSYADGTRHSLAASVTSPSNVALQSHDEEGMEGYDEGGSAVDRDGCITLNAALTALLSVCLVFLYSVFA